MQGTMDRQFAEMVLNAVFRASRELGEMGTMAKTFCSEDIGPELKYKLGHAIAEIGQIAEQVYQSHPDLREIVEARIDAYGRWS